MDKDMYYYTIIIIGNNEKQLKWVFLRNWLNYGTFALLKVYFKT